MTKQLITLISFSLIFFHGCSQKTQNFSSKQYKPKVSRSVPTLGAQSMSEAQFRQYMKSRNLR